MEKLTSKEEEVMQVLWRLENAYVKDIVPHFTNPPLHYNTVSTIVRNLSEKGYISHRTYGNTHEYFAQITKEDYQNRFVINKLVNQYFDNSYKNLVSYFAQNEKISAEELKEVLALIEVKSDE
jgi:BlaI family transcriptional regulator, penicillinase repressor